MNWLTQQVLGLVLILGSLPGAIVGIFEHSPTQVTNIASTTSVTSSKSISTTLPVVSTQNTPLTPVNSISSSQQVTSTITSQLGGLTDFSLSYPSQFGQPDYIFTPKTSVPGTIDEEDITFYKPNVPHTYPQPAANFYLNIEIGLLPINSGQTLEDIGNANLPGNTTWTQFSVDGHQAIVASIGSNSFYPYDPNPTYFIQLKNNLVLQASVSGNYDLKLTSAQMKSFREMEDNVIQSIKFAPGN